MLVAEAQEPSCGGRKSATGLLPGTSLLLTAAPFSRRANRKRDNSTGTQCVLRKCWQLNRYLDLEPHTYDFFPHIHVIGQWVLHALHSKRFLHLRTKIPTDEMMRCLGSYSIRHGQEMWVWVGMRGLTNGWWFLGLDKGYMGVHFTGLLLPNFEILRNRNLMTKLSLTVILSFLSTVQTFTHAGRYLMSSNTEEHAPWGRLARHTRGPRWHVPSVRLHESFVATHLAGSETDLSPPSLYLCSRGTDSREPGSGEQ